MAVPLKELGITPIKELGITPAKPPKKRRVIPLEELGITPIKRLGITPPKEQVLPEQPYQATNESPVVDNLGGYEDFAGPPMSRELFDNKKLSEFEDKRDLTPEGTRPEYKGKHALASAAKNFGAAAIGGIPDIVVAAHNLVGNAWGAALPFEGYGEANETKTQNNEWPSVSHLISQAVDKWTGGYTEDTDAFTKHMSSFLGSLVGAKGQGRGLAKLGQSGKLGAASKNVEKVGKGVEKYLGLGETSATNISAALAGGAGVAASEIMELPAYAEIPLIMLSYIAGGRAGRAAEKSLEPLFSKVPGLKERYKAFNIEKIASMVDPDYVNSLMKSALLDKEMNFLKESTISKLSPETRTQLENNPALLKPHQFEEIFDVGGKDFLQNFEKIEKRLEESASIGEFTGSSNVVNFEDRLANKANVSQFDKRNKNSKDNIFQNVERLKEEVSPLEADATSLSENVVEALEEVLKQQRDKRSTDWLRDIGGANLKENNVKVDNYVKLLKDFTKKYPDTEGNRVARFSGRQRLAALKQAPDADLVKAPKLDEEALKDLEKFRKVNQEIFGPDVFEKIAAGKEKDIKISLERINDILVGNYEDLKSYPERSLSRKYMGESKAALEKDLKIAEEHGEGAARIKKARNNFREKSKIIDGLNESVLFNDINTDKIKVVEKVANSFRNITKSQLKLTQDALKKSEGYTQIWNQLKKFYISEALQAATEKGASHFSIPLFMKNLPKKELWPILFEDPRTATKINDLAVYLRRISDFRATRHNSKTFQRLEGESGDLKDKLSSSAWNFIVGSYNKAKDKILEITGDIHSNNMAELLLDPKYRKEIIEASQKKLNVREKYAGKPLAIAVEKSQENK